MNSPVHPAASPAYDDDVYGWALGQAALIRAGRPNEIDWDRIAEELEDVGQSRYDALESALRILMIHLLKWEHQPAFRSRSWINAIREQRRQVERRLQRSPGLEVSLDALRDEAYRQARIAAQAETGMDLAAFPIDAPGWNVIANAPVDQNDLPPR